MRDCDRRCCLRFPNPTENLRRTPTFWLAWTRKKKMTKRKIVALAPKALASPARLQPNYKDNRRRFGGNSYRQVTRARATLISYERKIYGNLGIHFDRLPIEQIGFVLPLLHHLNRGLHQQRISGKSRKIDNVTVFADQGMQHDCPLNPVLTCFLRVLRVDALHEQPLRDTLRHPHPRRRCRLRRGLLLRRGCALVRRLPNCQSTPRGQHHQSSERQPRFSRVIHSTPPGPAPAACSANTAAPQSESHSNTPGTSWLSDQAVSLPDSSAPPARSLASRQRNRLPQQRVENSPAQ